MVEGRLPRPDLGPEFFHTPSEIRRILRFFSCQRMGYERRVSLGLGGFQEATPIYRNPVAGSRPACMRALRSWQGQAGGGRTR